VTALDFHADEAAFALHRLTGIDARLVAWDWPFARDEAGRIAEKWAALIADKPRLFNGPVLLQREMRIEQGVARCAYFPTDYASFIAFRDFGPQDTGVRNGFAMAALRARDGAFLLGEMGPHTANAGKVYFAAGTPDPSDVTPEGMVDLPGSVLRELEEETGLAAHEVGLHDDWTVVVGTTRAAFMRPVAIDLPADEARALILSRLTTLEDDELSDIVVVRDEADLDPARMPAFMRAYMRAMFRGQG
jgi:8-oxo-dGTP pyrophosphatase MutT (NUDIX family)